MVLPARARRVLRNIRQSIPSGVVLGRRSKGEGPTEFIPLDEIMQAQLDAISSTRGSILYRGASAWVALPPGNANEFLRTNGAGADPSWEATGGAGAQSFSGYGPWGALGVNSGNFAIKGVIFQPTQDITITSVDAIIDAANTDQQFDVIIVDCDSAGTIAGTPNTRTSLVVNARSTNIEGYSFVFNTPPTLTAGNYYLIATRLVTQAAATPAAGTNPIRAMQSNAITFFVPGILNNAIYLYNVTSFSGGESASSSAGLMPHIGINGVYAAS